MKAFLFGMAAFFFAMYVWLFCHDYNMNHMYYNQLRTAAEEASASAALFTYPEQENEGKIIFNKPEGHKAIKELLKVMLKTGENLNPTQNSYWQDKISYKAYFFDDSNTIYPQTFMDQETGFRFEVKRPSVIVTINAGKARYTIKEIADKIPNIRSAAHEVVGW